MSLGPIMMDLVATQISDTERELLLNPQVGGVILFTRNYESIEQITDLIRQIHNLRSPHLLISVDHEGGRVQRFREGFSRLPPASVFGKIFDEDNKKGRDYAELAGWLMAAELRSIGVDFSFAPVLDLGHGISGVIGDRAFHKKPDIAATLAFAYMRGMSRAGMSAVGKHFPGHGGVAEDSHVALPVDDRTLDALMKSDIIPFEKMIHDGLPAIMPAHVIYSKVDKNPAGYSETWLKNILRKRLNFSGVIFSDDLSMEAACAGGSYTERANMALQAGCDMVLVCNHQEGVVEVVDALQGYLNPAAQLRLTRMHGKSSLTRAQLQEDAQWKNASKVISELVESPWIEMDV